MFPALAARIVRTTDPRLLAKFAWNFGVKGLLSVEKFKSRIKRGEYFPPFLYLSIINSCNLRCQGCWVDVEAEREAIDLDTLNRTINDAKAHGNAFFGILGGEPFMHPELLDLLAAHPDAYFQVFTNGQFITDKIAQRLRKIGNATPLISVEGREVVSDERRGKRDVFNKTMRGLDACLRERILTGVATSVCQTNIDDLCTESWLRELIARGVHYCWFHTYRPVGPKMNPQLALTPEQLVRVRRFVVEMRARVPIAIIDAYNAVQFMAQLVNESNFTSMYQQGEHFSTLMVNVDENSLLVIVFPTHLTVGSMKYYASPAAKSIGERIQLATDRAPGAGLDLSDLDPTDVQALFRKK